MRRPVFFFFAPPKSFGVKTRPSHKNYPKPPPKLGINKFPSAVTKWAPLHQVISRLIINSVYSFRGGKNIGQKTWNQKNHLNFWRSTGQPHKNKGHLSSRYTTDIFFPTNLKRLRRWFPPSRWSPWSTPFLISGLGDRVGQGVGPPNNPPPWNSYGCFRK